MKYSAVIFDLFGTLVDFGPPGEYERSITAMDNVLAAAKEDFQRLWTDTYRLRFTGEHPDTGHSIKYICSELGLKATDDQIQRAAQVRLNFSSRSPIPRDDVPDTLRWYKTSCHKFDANQARFKMGLLAYNLLHLVRELYMVGEEVKRSIEWIIRRMVKVASRVSYHSRYWWVHVSSAFPLRHHYQAVFGLG